MPSLVPTIPFPSANPTVSAAPTEFVTRCKVSRKSDPNNQFLDVVSAVEEGWIQADYTRLVRNVKCANCVDVEFVDCRDVQCLTERSCAGSSFTDSGKYNRPEDFSNVYCIGKESCKGSSFTGVDRVTCVGKDSCSSSLSSSVFFDVKYIDCDGDGSCVEAMFGSTNHETKKVTCAGAESCLFVKTWAVETLDCFGSRACNGGSVFGTTKKLECNGDLACDGAAVTGSKNLKCGRANSCGGLEWL